VRARGVAAALALGWIASAAASAAPDAGVLQRGEQVYARCAACHSIEGNRSGPQHCGLFGRRAGSEPHFQMYSKALRETRIVWDARTLDHFLQNPVQAVPGTAMAYAGVKDPKERSELIAWLQVATVPGKTCKPAG
jgi:cytochrome c